MSKAEQFHLVIYKPIWFRSTLRTRENNFYHLVYIFSSAL